jgi:BirA family transcriptional regulator, biotin operon repressor / biotin---[acetyl-CoA-carboxylase] ligase
MPTPEPTPEQEELNPAEIDADLRETIFAGHMYHFRTIDSTNTHALEQARQGAPHGSFYIADEQTAGRGRSDHTWLSAASQGLYLSVLLRPPLATADLVWLPLLAGLAAHRAIREVTMLAPDLRWPNDLLIGPRKAGGILVEALADPAGSAAVIGIGINLHQQQFPAGLATRPTSLDLETGRCTSRRQLLIALLQALHDESEMLRSPSSLAATPRRIAAISSWVEGRPVEVHGPQACTGVTAGLDAHGFLRVHTAGGLVTITTGGIRAIRHGVTVD